MNSNYHILVEHGEDAGKQLTIPAEGARVGRSSKNDIVLVDPMLSRHHCRIFFKENGLWVSDLGSANETLLNSEPVTEAPIYLGNRITIGDSILRVVDDGRKATPGTPPTSVDLGLASGVTPEPTLQKRLGVGPLVTILGAVAAITIALFMMKAMTRPTPPPTPIAVPPPPVDMTLSVDYEKVEASSDNIFYYHLAMTPEGTLSIAIDDLENNRSVRESKQVEPKLLKGLAETLKESGFFELNKRYEGVAPDVLVQSSISITIGNETLRATVLNRAEPDIFTMVREKLEDFGRIELGLWAIQFSTEKLLEMANDTYLLAKKLYAERLIATGNLSASILSFKEAAWYLETVEEKPDFYADILESLEACEADLKQRYEELNFRAERAMRLREWDGAAAELRTLLDLIPSREDPRHAEARKKLVEVDARLEALK
ncbi:MAG: FHA domain-containing protein [Verrucomicrobia bacterium]|jgi:pSer/pThr/pTyr-binding forkhead associated (FHA) protein|nr:FHA domain-containing protein [Verrucomicrobiota bacterium]